MAPNLTPSNTEESKQTVKIFSLYSALYVGIHTVILALWSF